MVTTKDKVIYLQGIRRELDYERNRLYEFATKKNSFCDKEVVALSMQLDEILNMEMRVQGHLRHQH